jgi:2-dehydro-3-deoxyphosphogluconate aldolase / (4S)-4-hydroxy-2-oxoglutarate aldolase
VGQITQLLTEVGRIGVVPVLPAVAVTQAATLGAALKEGGLPCVEVTFRSPSAEAVVRTMSSDSALLVGAGTILTSDQVDRAVAAGAQFIVAPGLTPEVVLHCLDLRVPVIPGVATASEIQAALGMGIEVVKLFPVEPLGGIKLLAALASPFPGLRFVPTGGVGPDLIGSYLAQPTVHAVGCSWVVEQSIVAERDWEEVTGRAAYAVAAAHAARAELLTPQPARPRKTATA